MLEAGTKGGPVPLEASSGQLKFIVKKITTGTFERPSLNSLAEKAPKSAYNNDYENLWNLIELHHIAEKYLFEDVGSGIRQLIARFTHEHPPLALVFACQCDPANGAIARAALQAFANHLDAHTIGHYFKSSYDSRDEGISYASPLLDSVTRQFARELGGDAVLAYARALQGVFGSMTTSEYDEDDRELEWEKVADLFVEDMEINHQDDFRDFMED
jgi:hypothetical protein